MPSADLTEVVANLRERLAVLETTTAHHGALLEHSRARGLVTDERINALGSRVSRLQDWAHWAATQAGRIEREISKLSSGAARPKIETLAEAAKYGTAIVIIILIAMGKLTAEQGKGLIMGG
jgi:hypothetical protein